ncbi:MFS transporter [Streptomyces violascens]|uniref:MFS transporter n=1 Tax=Streptomyces violascens TaxID=67381 RepID=UPI0037949BB8
MATAPTTAAPGRTGMALFALCLAVFIVPYGLSSAPVALPAMGDDLHAGVVPLQWVVNAYNVTAASFMMAAGSIADRIGRKRVFAFGIGLYGVSALIGALAPGIVVLDVARGIAGVAAAAMMTAGVSVTANMFQGAARTKAFAYVGVTIGAGLALGPTTSGLLVSGLGWRSVFWVQFAIAVLSMLGMGLIEESKDPDAKAVDWPGTLTFTPALFFFTLAVIEGPQWGWGNAAVWGLLAACGALLAAFVMVERRRTHPMFDLSLFREPRFMAVNLLATAVSFGFVGLMVLLPSYLVGANGLTGSGAGLAMLLLTAPVLAFPLVAGRLVQAGLSLRAVLTGGLLLAAAGLTWLGVPGAGIHPGIGVPALAGPLLLIGTGVGLIYGLMDGAAVSTVPPAKVGMATGMFNTIRLAGEAVAVAAMVAALVSLVQPRIAAGLGRIPGAEGLDAGAVTASVTSGSVDAAGPGSASGPALALADFLADSYTEGFRVVLWGAALVCGVAGVVLYLMLGGRGGARVGADERAPEAGMGQVRDPGTGVGQRRGPETGVRDVAPEMGEPEPDTAPPAEQPATRTPVDATR